ncbi:MAG: PAS domain S-box protein [Candidatus Heimdallarchaeota archaeon]
MAEILFVDDEKSLLLLAKEYLEEQRSDFHVSIATSAHSALQNLKENHYDAIVSDFQMPGMDGLELLKRIRDEYNNIPFIMFTGRGREEVAMRALNLGADYYLMKGMDLNSMYGELAHIIDRVLEHRKTETALKKSEELFSKAFRAGPQAILISRLSDGIILEVNKAAQEILGYQREELIGLSSMELNLTTGEDRQKLRQYLLEQGFFRNVETIFFTKSGRKGFGLISGEILDIEGEKCLLWIANDITERKRNEKLLEQQKDELRRIFDGIPEPAFLWERQSNGIIVLRDVNRAVVNRYSEVVKERIGQPLEKIVAPYPESIVRIKRVMETGKAERAEISRADQTGTALRLISDVVKVAENLVLSTAKDITELKLTEEALRASNSKNRAILSAIPDLIFQISDDGTFLSSEAANEDLYLSPEDFLGKRVEEILPKELAELTNRNIKEALQTGEIQVFEYQLPMKGTMRAYECRMVPNGPKQVLAIIRDLTEQLAAVSRE